MKKFFLSMLVGMMALGTMAQIGTFTVKGTFEGLGDSVKFQIVDQFSDYPFAKASYAITGEMLEVQFNIPKASTLKVIFNENGEESYISEPAIPGETIIFYQVDDKNFQVTGSQFYVDYNEAENSVMESYTAISDFFKDLQMSLASGTPREEVMKTYEEKFPALEKALIDKVMEYVAAHPDQEASAALLATLGRSEEIEIGQALLTERVRNSAAADLYKTILEAAEKEREKEALLYALEGNMAPDFTLNDINGKPLALSSLRGKWVIIDFWGSWCGWCIKGIPKMKEYYAKYSDKLEILGVDCNDTVEKWKAAVAKHELPWVHVYCDMEVEENNPLLLYGIQGFPTKVVVDPEGRVAEIIVGEDPEFYEYLDEVLK